MRDSMRLVTTVLLMPFLLMATFILFWVIVGLTFLEAIVALPLVWFVSAEGKFSDGTFSLEEKLANKSVGTYVDGDTEQELTNVKYLNHRQLLPLPDAG